MKHILTPRLADLQILYTTKPHARKSLAKRFSRAAPGLTPTPNRPQDAICRMVLPHIPHPLPPILSFHPLSPPLATRSKVLYLVPIHCLLHPPHINRRPYPSPRFQTARPELHLHTREAQRTSQNGNVRHPSYPTLLLCQIASAALIMRWKGVTGCWLPAWLARWSFLDVGGLIFFGVGCLYGLLVRVQEEEDMLRSEFGEDYEAYAKRTKKFLPWII
jgi:hypothetical protein